MDALKGPLVVRVARKVGCHDDVLRAGQCEPHASDGDLQVEDGVCRRRVGCHLERCLRVGPC